MESKGGGVAEQVRRVHIIYFLSRMGQIEHPHLLRVHHSSRNGVHLRDVKRWLSDLRGKDMPDNFCWSYKRKYKAGYVWQDLVDDDLITPVSDNEYVLKGSEICANPFDSYLCPEKKVQTQIPDPIEEKKPPTEAKPENPVTLIIDNSAKITEIDQEDSGPFDSETSTVTEDSIKANAAFIFKLDNDSHTKSKPESEIVEIPSSPCALKKNKENKKNKKEKEEEEEEEENKPTKPKTGTTKSESFSFPKSKSYSSGASNVFRNLLKCGAIETKDSAMMMINKVDKTSKKPLDEQPLLEAGSGSQRVSGSAWNQQQPYSSNSRKNSNGGKSSKKQKNGLSNQKTTSAVFKPVTEPNCSQCGKTFKPEKMHTHMKSCRGLKSFSKSGNTAAVIAAAAAEKAPSSSSQRSSDASSNEGISGYFLTR